MRLVANAEQFYQRSHGKRPLSIFSLTIGSSRNLLHIVRQLAQGDGLVALKVEADTHHASERDQRVWVIRWESSPD